LSAIGFLLTGWKLVAECAIRGRPFTIAQTWAILIVAA
jgi:hypothetical protein